MHPFKKMIYMLRNEIPISFNPFDFMVVRFTYTKPLDGTDLDIMVYYDNTGTIYDKNAVGYNQLPNDIKIPTNSTLDTDAYLWWATDDNESPNGECVEAVVIGVNNFNANESVTGDIINVFLRLGWYAAIGTAKIVDLELTTYLGGTMSKVGTNIINTGGVMVDTPQTKTINITSGIGQVTEIDSNLAGVISYNKVTKSAILT